MKIKSPVRFYNTAVSTTMLGRGWEYKILPVQGMFWGREAEGRGVGTGMGVLVVVVVVVVVG